MKRWEKRLVGAVVLAGGAAALRPGTHRAVRHGAEMAGSRLRYARGRLTGVRYRLRGGHPDAGADDGVVADRVRSVLGSLTQRLDVPHVHVTVEDGVVLLHGVVDRAAQAVRIEQTALEVYGVTGVASYLHVGLTPGDTRPSAGHGLPSPVLRRLLDAAGAAGIAPADRARVVRAVLSTFADRLPEGERAHVMAHVPLDVKVLLAAPRCSGRHPARTVATFADRVATAAGALTRDDALAASVAVLRELRADVPDEAADVAAVLPAELRSLWPANAATS
ncbi:MAG TPA: DUF2267 domain-containing protein [Frankiaceae bacterium]|nr:DUF2267 domain-containing protein [Frankiaceae bacterium]